MSDNLPRPSETAAPAWRPLAALDRRVLGVLVEKAKTTPDGYPMSINSLRSGCNQKNNRYPLMEAELEDIEESLVRLRAAGAVAEVQGGGRVSRFRHYMYEWLGVDKAELAVMTELLLRGAQTEGELRGRAARMEPIADVSALRPVLASLAAKGLIVSLTPQGRGHIVTHALYEPRELEKLRADAASNHRDASDAAEPAASPRPAPISQPQAAPASAPPQVNRVTQNAPPAPASTRPVYVNNPSVDELRRDLDEMREEMAKLRKDLDDLWSNFR